MFSEIMSLALGNGLWAALFCLLFLYQLKDSRARENKYTLTISSLTQSLGSVKDIKRDCESIKTDCKEILGDCKEIRTYCGVLRTKTAISRHLKQRETDNAAGSIAGNTAGNVAGNVANNTAGNAREKGAVTDEF